MSQAPKLALACGALTLFSFANFASSELSPPVVRFPVEQPVALSARVALLEQKVHALEQRLKAHEAAHKATPPTGVLADPCEPPYTVDPQGMRIPKWDCL